MNGRTMVRRFCNAFPLLVALTAMSLPFGSSAQTVDVNVAIAPPELPVYDQPEIPGPGYIWTPGFWGYGPEGYYWVREPGLSLRPSASSGPQGIGAGETASMVGTPDIGGRISDSTAASITVSAMWAPAMKAATGETASSRTTGP